MEILGCRRVRVESDAVQIGELAPLGVVRVDVGADLKQARRVSVCECFQSSVFAHRQRSDVRFDLGI